LAKPKSAGYLNFPKFDGRWCQFFLQTGHVAEIFDVKVDAGLE
jgi:hypothetical protein